MRKTKLILLLLAALLTGVFVGFKANDAIIRARIQRFSQMPADMPAHIAGRLTERLKLTPEQQAQVLAILRTHEARMEETRVQSRLLIDNFIEEVRIEIAQHLTPEQQAEHKRILAEMQQRRLNDHALRRALPPPPPKGGP